MSRRLRLLDLYSCAGGAGVGYARAGFDVVGVDINPQPNYPFEHHVADAIEFAREYGWMFDAVHASPPCQIHTALTKGTRNTVENDYLDLIPETREVLEALGKPYVIENVEGAGLRVDLKLCGLMFDLKVFRHRIFEVGGWEVEQPAHVSHRGHRVAGWRHGVFYEGDMYSVYGTGGSRGDLADWQAAMGIDWSDKKSEIAQAIPPAYSEFIGKQLIERINSGSTLSALQPEEEPALAA